MQQEPDDLVMRAKVTWTGSSIVVWHDFWHRCSLSSGPWLLGWMLPRGRGILVKHSRHSRVTLRPWCWGVSQSRGALFSCLQTARANCRPLIVSGLDPMRSHTTLFRLSSWSRKECHGIAGRQSPLFGKQARHAVTRSAQSWKKLLDKIHHIHQNSMSFQPTWSQGQFANQSRLLRRGATNLSWQRWAMDGHGWPWAHNLLF